MATTADVHVGDIGTLYKAKVQDLGTPIDISTATVKKLIFKAPAGVVEKVATVIHPDADWYLTYTAVAADSNAGGIHSKKGTVSWQGYVEFASGDRYHTNIETYEIEKNLN